MRGAFEQRYGDLGAPAAVVDCDVVSLGRTTLPERHAGVGSVLAQDVVGHIHEVQLTHIVVVVARDALEGVKAGFERRHTVPHVLDDGVRSGDLNVLFSAASGASGAHVLIGVATGADDRRIAAASGEFISKAAGGCAAGDFTFLVEGGAVDGAGRRNQNALDGGHAEFRFN